MKIRIVPANRLTPDHITAWSTLQRRDPAVDSPLFRPEYTLAVAAVCDGVEVAVFEHDERFVGFFPFERDRRNVGRPVAWRLSDMNGVVVDSQIDWSVKHLMQATQLSAWHFDH